MLYFYSEQLQSGIAVEYPDIIIQATSREDGLPNVYCQLEEGRTFPNQRIPEGESRDEVVTELKFIPHNPESGKWPRTTKEELEITDRVSS